MTDGELTSGGDEAAVVVTTTVATSEDADEMASALVEQRLAACVQISGPITSIYRWDGAIQRESEWELSIKTATARLADVTAWLDAHHPYDVPQMLTTVVGGSKVYLDWIADETGSA